jgi:hypothetical protein
MESGTTISEVRSFAGECAVQAAVGMLCNVEGVPC